MKLKPIQTNITVSTPTEAEAKELLAILHENGWDVSEPFDGIIKETEGILVRPEHDLGWWGDINFAKSIGHAILTLAEFKERYCEEEKPQLKFNKGDKVVIQESYYKEELCGQIGVVTGRPTPFSYYVEIDKTIYQASAKDLELYTEPETKPTEDMETKENRNLSQDVANCDKPENKQLNLCELLKGHEGETFYSPFYGDVTLEEIHTPTVETPKYYLLVRPKSYSVGRELILPNGINHDGGQVVLYPSHALFEQYPLDPYTAWSVWDDKQYIHRLAARK